MIAIGLIVAFLGFLISFFSLTLTTSVSGRMILTLIGLAVSLFGIMGPLNRAFLKKAVWRR